MLFLLESVLTEGQFLINIPVLMVIQVKTYISMLIAMAMPLFVWVDGSLCTARPFIA